MEVRNCEFVYHKEQKLIIETRDVTVGLLGRGKWVSEAGG